MDPTGLIEQWHAPPEVPETPTKRRLSRDERLRVRTLREIGWTHEAIMKQYGISRSAVRYACNNPPTPKKHTGRPARITEEEVQDIIAFICLNRENRRLPYARVLEVIADLKARGVTIMSWPAFSPDLNPIETIWCWMKSFFQEKYGYLESISSDRLRDIIREAWDQITVEQLRYLIHSMPERCRAVIAANGMYTKY
jgi:transposase